MLLCTHVLSSAITAHEEHKRNHFISSHTRLLSLFNRMGHCIFIRGNYDCPDLIHNLLVSIRRFTKSITSTRQSHSSRRKKLASNDYTPHSSILSASKIFYGKSKKIRFSRHTRSEGRKRRGEIQINMSVNILNAGHMWSAPFIVPPSYSVTVDIESSKPIDIYFVKDAQALELFKAGDRAFPKITNQTNYYSKINLAQLWPKQSSPTLTGLAVLIPQLYSSVIPGATWFLVIGNTHPENIAIFYRVYNS
jgi:hypothetical protein